MATSDEEGEIKQSTWFH